MNALVWLGLGNLLLATPLAVAAWLSGRWLRRPAITHGLWLLVLLKLVTPPLGILPMGTIGDTAPIPELPKPRAEVLRSPGIEPAETAVDFPTLELSTEPLPIDAVETVAAQAPIIQQTATTAPVRIPWTWIVPIVGGLWLFGATIVWVRLLTKCVRFQRLLQGAAPADAALHARVAQLAAELGVRELATVLTPGTLSPLLWVWGRAGTLVLPRDLFEQLPPEQQTTLLVHELAHWKRGDHWVRRLECLAGGLYWWCPLVWAALAGIRQAEEELCDAWVVATVPDSARDYALALVETVDFLAGCSSPAQLALPPLASGLGPFPSLQRRLTMIFRTGTPRRLTFAGIAGLVALGGLLLTWTPAPSVAQDERPKKERGADDQRQLEELKAMHEKLKQRLAELEKNGGDDKDRQIEELQKLREKLKARLADAEKGGGDSDKIREKIRERFQDFKKEGGPNPEEMKKFREEMETRRAELEKMQRELQRKAEELRALGEKMGEQGQKFRFEFKFRDGDRKPDPREPGAGPNPRPDPRPNPNPRPGGDPRAGGDIERRMDEMERKLDMLIREIGNQRGGQGGPGGNFPRRGPGGPNDGPPRKDGKEGKDDPR